MSKSTEIERNIQTTKMIRYYRKEKSTKFEEKWHWKHIKNWSLRSAQVKIQMTIESTKAQTYFLLIQKLISTKTEGNIQTPQIIRYYRKEKKHKIWKEKEQWKHLKTEG